MMKAIILFISLIGLCWGCADRREDILKSVKNEKICSELIMNLSDRGICKNGSFVKQGNWIVVKSGMQDEGALSIDLQTSTRSDLFKKDLSFGAKKRELSSFNSTDGHVVTALDFRTGELLENGISTLSRSGDSGETIQLPKGQQHLIAAKTSSFVIATGFYEAGRYLLYSLSDYSARYFLSYPEHPDYPGLKEKTKAMLYASNVLRVRPDEKAFVCGDMYSGVIDFCNITPAGVERVQLVCLHHSKVDISERPRERVQYYQDNRFGFLDIAVTQEHVYALYSGMTYRDARDRAFESPQVLVYDWEGNLVRSCTVDRGFTRITYDHEENELYGITPLPEAELVKISIE